MEEDKTEINFTCALCGLSEKCIYKGKEPMFNKQLVFLNDCYIIKDPFSPPNKGQILILGSDCSVCLKPVCQSPECSFFYEKSFCRECTYTHINSFPLPVQLKLKAVKESKLK